MLRSGSFDRSCCLATVASTTPAPAPATTSALTGPTVAHLAPTDGYTLEVSVAEPEKVGT
jgi:hypothetical protein